jgi:hypothetical protein
MSWQDTIKKGGLKEWIAGLDLPPADIKKLTDEIEHIEDFHVKRIKKLEDRVRPAEAKLIRIKKILGD